MATPALTATQTFQRCLGRRRGLLEEGGRGRGCAYTRLCLDVREERLRHCYRRQEVPKFDPDGNAKVLAALKASDKKDHLRVNVSGDVPGDTIKVTSVKLL